jgi:hypothetical protein
MFWSKAPANREAVSYFAVMRAAGISQLAKSEKTVDLRRVVDARSGETRSSVYEAMRKSLCAYFGCEDAPGKLQVVEFSITANELTN